MRKFFIVALFLMSKVYADCNPGSYCETCCFEETCKDMYLTVGAGGVFPCKNSRTRGDSSAVLFTPTEVGTSLFFLPDVIWKNKYEPGFELNAALGFSVKSNCRLEAEFLYQNFKRQISGSYDWTEIDAVTKQVYAKDTDNFLYHSSTRANIYSLLSNIYFDYATSTPLTLVFGAGVGVAWMESNRKEHQNVLHIVSLNPPINETSQTLEKSAKLFGTAFAWQMKLGAKYDVGGFSIGLNYRLFGTTHFQASTSRIIANPGTIEEAVFKVPRDEIRGLLNNSIDLSVSYIF